MQVRVPVDKQPIPQRIKELEKEAKVAWLLCGAIHFFFGIASIVASLLVGAQVGNIDIGGKINVFGEYLPWAALASAIMTGLVTFINTGRNLSIANKVKNLTETAMIRYETDSNYDLSALGKDVSAARELWT